MRPIAYLGDHVSLTVTELGSRIYVDTEDTVVSPHILLEGMWESWVTSWVRQTLRPGHTFLDVGAHCGWYTLLACHAVGPTGRVHAVEPNRKLAKLLRQSLSINGYLDRAEVCEVAAWSEDIELTFDMPATGSGNGHVRPAGGGRYNVKAVRLDGHVAFPETRVDLVKLDVEGAEAEAIRGLSGIIERNSAIKLLV